MQDREDTRPAGSTGSGTGGNEQEPRDQRRPERREQGRLGTASVVAEPDRPDEC